jgi:hypothetical protein
MTFLDQIPHECEKAILNLNNHLASRGHTNLEGNSGQILRQNVDLVRIASVYGRQWPIEPSVNDKPLKILEIGFNAGHSALAFLVMPTAQVTSIDIGSHTYVLDAKAFIDNQHPLRHTLIIGDSRQALPNYLQQHPNEKFDIIFIDGAHDYSTCKSDLDYCLKMAHSDTMIIMDDVTFPVSTYEWTIGPSRAWSEAKMNNRIDQKGLADYCPGRSMVWGVPTHHRIIPSTIASFHKEPQFLERHWMG